jgi:glycine C-acetyltransferase
MKDVIEAELTSIKDAGTWKSERVITTRQGASIAVKDQPGTILNFCSNNYLGLSSHPEVIQAGISALESRGAGLSSVRFICGTQVSCEPSLCTLPSKSKLTPFKMAACIVEREYCA